MKTEFNDEEIYKVYSREIMDEMTNIYKISPLKSSIILKEEDFRNKFVQNIEDYDFVEPAKIAQELLIKYADFLNINIKINENNGEVILRQKKNPAASNRSKVILGGRGYGFKKLSVPYITRSKSKLRNSGKSTIRNDSNSKQFFYNK